jgi:hypothetical protein
MQPLPLPQPLLALPLLALPLLTPGDHLTPQVLGCAAVWPSVVASRL